MYTIMISTFTRSKQQIITWQENPLNVKDLSRYVGLHCKLYEH